MLDRDIEDFSLIDGSFIKFLECRGSVRLVNAIMSCIDDMHFPYSTFKQFLRDPIDVQVRKIKQQPNIGRLSAEEYCVIVEHFVSEVGGLHQNEGGHEELVENDISLIDGTFTSFLEERGSMRLVNSVKTSLDQNRFPYSTSNEFLKDAQNTRIRLLKKIPNLGNKSVAELCGLLDSFIVQELQACSVDLVPQDNEKEDDFATNEAEILSINVTPKKFEIEEELSLLKERERYVIERRFGIEVESRMTLEEIGQELSVTRERIRQIESSALRRLGRRSKWWKIYLDKQQHKIVEILFGTSTVLKEVGAIYGIYGLAITVVDTNIGMYLKRIAVQLNGFWIRPGLDCDCIYETFYDLTSALNDNSLRLPMNISEFSDIKDIGAEEARAACEILPMCSVYKGYLVRGKRSSRKRRTVNILNMYHSYIIPSLCDIWHIKIEYWNYYPEDRCNGRDLMICMEEYPSHFINLHELGWMIIGVNEKTSLSNGNNIGEGASQTYIMKELYQEPVTDSDGLPNKIFRMFEHEGPMQLKVAAERFVMLFPEYSPSSIYPMLVTYAVFLRLAPGVMGIQSHLLEMCWVEQARTIMLNDKQIDLYILAKRSAPPMVDYPLWNAEMEHLWCKWLFEKLDNERLGQLLGYVDVTTWNIDVTEREWWKRQKERKREIVTEPAIRRWDERFIDSDSLITALVISSIKGTTNWMHINQGLGWRIQTTRVALVLAILIHIGALRPAGKWFENHILTDIGKSFLKKLSLIRLNQKEIKHILEEAYVCNIPALDLGWAKEFSFIQLEEKIVYVKNEMSSTIEPEEGVDLDSFYRTSQKYKIDEMLDEFMDEEDEVD